MIESAVVITVSTRAAAGVYEDKSGPIIATALHDLGFDVLGPVVVPDGEPVGAALREAVMAGHAIVITTGGTATVTLTTLPFDYDLKVLNSAGTQLAISQAGSTTSESISRTYTAGTYYAQVYGYNGANSATSCYTLRVQLGTASRGGDLITGDVQKVDVFPNPATNVVNVNLTGYTGKSDMSMFDVNGRVVLHREVSLVNSQLDISALPAGVYMIRIKNGGKDVNMTKIIKQ